MTRHVACNKDHLHPPVIAHVLWHPRLTHTIQQSKQGATIVGRAPPTLLLCHQSCINGLTNHSPTSTLQIKGRGSQDLLTKPSLAKLHRGDIGTRQIIRVRNATRLRCEIGVRNAPRPRGRRPQRNASAKKFQNPHVIFRVIRVFFRIIRVFFRYPCFPRYPRFVRVIRVPKNFVKI